MSRDIELADEIVEALNGQQWAIPFQAVREYVPDWDVSKGELEKLACAVIPENRSADPFERNSLRFEYMIVVCFSQRLKVRTRDELDGLLDVVEAVTDHLQLGVVTVGDRNYVNHGWEDRVRFDPRSLSRESDGGLAVYTGSFLSVTAFPFRLEP